MFACAKKLLFEEILGKKSQFGASFDENAIFRLTKQSEHIYIVIRSQIAANTGRGVCCKINRKNKKVKQENNKNEKDFSSFRYFSFGYVGICLRKRRRQCRQRQC
ncbi:MAG: hypothetical protein M3209_18420 [Acidobacteriota bacterium]|nr:hypothetical protein [Acidobacteriota bacterium]